ncbi:MAG: sodium:proton antiporter [Magnetococcales bacterium]|nr:sodium:proton antiporter [Magnetococcales bacterium]
MSGWLAVLLFAAVFVAFYSGRVDRRLAMMGGAGLFLLLGWLLDGFYTPRMALDAIYFDTLILLFGMSLISDTLARSGLFAVLAERAALYAMGSGWLTLVLFSLLTYLVSSVVNNLAAMVVMLPVTLEQCRLGRINPVPILIAEVVASNLGGASTMIGDFPNMIIASAAHLHFVDFLAGMMVPCLLLLAAMLLFFQVRRHLLGIAVRPDPGYRPGTLLTAQITDPYLYRLGLVVLSLTLLGFLGAKALGIRPATVALSAGLLLLVTGRFAKESLLEAMNGGDILFFLGLFVMVGGLRAAGVLDGVTWLISTVGGGNSRLELLLLLVMAGLVTLFLNAGPSTAFFIPVAADMSGYIPGPIVWWALSLGVLAGSSASLTGATAGSVAVSYLERHLVRFPAMRASLIPAQGLDAAVFLRQGLPIMALFITVSALYILLVMP